MKISQKTKVIKDPFKNCEWKNIALKISYNGKKFMVKKINKKQGFEKSDTTEENSIEDHLFKAIRKVNLIKTTEPENYTKAGRTDRGVSAAGNVVSFKAKLLKSISNKIIIKIIKVI